jgi:CheY-like chemotaxis protein/two-component sensor histidine kinase
MNVSHEIRTPMNGILGFINLMKEPDLSENERQSFIEIVNKSGERLLNTINDIVEISKIEIGDIHLEYEDIDTSELLRFHADFFKLQANEKGIDLKITKLVEGKSAIVKTDKQKLDGVLMNLIRNAIKFTAKGTIEVGNYVENEKLFFYVADSGKGIPEDKLEVIFDRFVQVELGNTRSYEGSGIGLSIVKAYAKVLNGNIQVKSKLGKGSTFLFSIPYSPVKNKPDEINENETKIIMQKKHTLLIAEDDEVNYYFMESILSKEFELLHAESGTETLKLLKENPEISLILMDIKMPGEFDGYETTQKIREINQQIPIIAQTAYAMESDKMKALDAGCNDYISKPYSPNDLRLLIQQYCGQNENNS